MKIGKVLGCVLVLAMVLWGRATWAADVRPTVAIFNFEMKSGGEEWTWLEKGLADMFTTHFVRSSVPVIARDEMQALANKMKWVPELREQEKDLDEIKKQLKISYLVTGVYTVKDQDITLVAQVISVTTRTEVLRKEIAGKAQDVLDLEARLAAEILPFFKGERQAQSLPELAPWTRSIPAARALYEGVNLFDQGRYGEAWLQFRRAQATDRAYHDAQYWVARMYYFMNQFEHARLAYEKFIYEDRTHPRAADAVKEYLHTYESLNVSAETLLAVYAQMSAAYPDVKIDAGRSNS